MHLLMSNVSILAGSVSANVDGDPIKDAGEGPDGDEFSRRRGGWDDED